MKCVLIVHVEPLFRSYIKGRAQMIRDWIDDQTDIKDVFNITAGDELGENITVFPEFINYTEREYVWGYEPQDDDCIGEDYIPVSSHHKYMQLWPWMKKLSPDIEYIVVGGCRTECMQDILDMLDFFNHKVTVGPADLIYG